MRAKLKLKRREVQKNVAKKGKVKEINEPFGFVGGKELQEILDKHPDSVTDAEREILRARRSYLTKSQLKDFGLVKPKSKSADDSKGALAAPKNTKTTGAKKSGAKKS